MSADFSPLADAYAASRMLRVLKQAGVVAIWWKSLGADQPVSGLTGGFREFYAADLADRSSRVLPWRTTMPLDRYVGYERSRYNVHRTHGEGAERYFSQLETRLHERFGAGNPPLPLGYVQYLYLGKKP